MKIQLQKLIITNFKGIKQIDIPFSHETFIHGANGTGKTTVVDAFMWLLFGKNSEDRKDFSIKPLDSGNKTTDKTDNEVCGYFLVDEQQVVMKRINREKWVKSRGELESSFVGNETLYFWNDVPVQAKEYTEKVSEVIREGLFKLITTPTAFNELDWKERRRMITTIVGDVSDQDIAKSRKDFQELINRLQNKSFEDFKKELAYQKKGYRQELEQIPARIDELHKSMPEAPDIALIQVDINNVELAIRQCDDRIKDSSKESELFFAEKTKRNERLYQIRTKISEMSEAEKTRIKSAYAGDITKRQDLEREIRNIDKQIKSDTGNIENLKQTANQIDSILESSRAEWHSINAKVLGFDPSEFSCPTCKRPFDELDIEAKRAEMMENFNKKKASDLASLSARGKAKNEEKTGILNQIKELEESIQIQKEILEGKLKEIEGIEPAPSDYDINIQAQKNMLENKDYIELTEESDRLKELNDLPFGGGSDTSSIETERKAHYDKLNQLKARLNDQEIINKTKSRIAELESRSRELAQAIADLEKQEFVVGEFEKTMVDLIEDKVNELFSLVKFKMFRQQINGGLEPCCDILINGVPFTDANTASQINAGIEIINILCKNYEVSAPIFIDGRESITQIIPTESQIINLVVDPSCKTLTIK